MLNDLPYKHRERASLYCAWLTKIAQRDPDVSTIWVLNTRWVIELAARLDTVDADCLPDVIDALPHTPDFDKMIADEREDCPLQYPNHHCNEIVRPRSQPVKYQAPAMLSKPLPQRNTKPPLQPTG